MTMDKVAEVAPKALFSKLNAAKVSPRIAPPVPSNPAENPDKVPPMNEFVRVGRIRSDFEVEKIR